ncbi:hypothetical protein P154DRAFT_456617 [Amniculicola lignicola CBS 123094]|uniref:Integral membrane protein n=1 Tax=Amniculicola lignicola CBS 123094 TaxID=1392246 RepID=A0A6A5WXS6_9PLEO|nr:hypothetical protein P154DRAFT_456617 [Amniculicola lignicola CBS 123094]
MTSTNHPLLLATAALNVLLSLGHTTKGLEQFKHPTLNALPRALRGAVTAGWYEGSVFFLITGILNYKYSQTGLVDLADKTVAGLLTSLCVGAGVHYYRTGDKPTATILWVVALLQGLGAKKAAL